MSAVMKPIEPRVSTTHGLTTKQAEFVRLYAGGMTQTKAAEQAGYTNPNTDGYRLLQTRSVIDAINREAAHQLETEGVRKATAFMIRAVDDPKLTGAVRIQAAKWVLENAGHGLAAQRAALGLPDTDKPLADMSITELDAFLAAGRGAIAQIKANEMRTIEGEARNSTSALVGGDAQVIEYKGYADT